MASPQEMQPTVEDCFSDDSEGGSIPFQGRRSPNAANVSTKRSHPSDLDKEMPPAQERAPTNIDLRSDSGYSSYTTATVSSTNSAQSAPPQRSPPQVPAAPVPPQQEAPKIRRRPTVSESTKPSSKASSRPKSISRTASTSSKPPAIIQQRERRPTVTQDPRPDHRDRRDSRVEPECADPRRTKYDPNAPAPAPRRHNIRPEIHPSQSARDVHRPSQEDTRSMRSDPTPSPYYPDQRQSYYSHAGAVIQPATTRPRRPSVSRPVSYSGEPGPQYHWTQGAPGGYAGHPQDHGPPLSQSALYRQSYSGQMGPPSGPYAAAPVYHPQYGYGMAPSYDGMQRPGMTHRNSTNIARTGPIPPPVVDQGSRDQYSARRGQPQSATQPRFPPQKQLQGEAYESYSESDSASSDEDDDYEAEPHPDDHYAQRALMPPPPQKLERTKSKAKPKSKSKKLQRPQISHAYTTSDLEHVRADRRKSQPVVVNHDPPTSRHRTTKSTNEPSRRQSVSRPPPPPREIQTEYPARGGLVYVHDSTKAERRRSAHYGKSYNDRHAEAREYERLEAEANAKADARARREADRREAEKAEARYQAEQERKREKRNSKVYYQPPAAFDSSDEYESEIEAPIPEAPAPPRRRRPTDAEGRKVKERAPQKTRRDEMKALEYINSQRGTDAPLNDHIHSAAKRASRVPSIPSHSGSSGSDRHTAVTSNGNNEIRLRVDANAPLSLQFNGDMEGRTMRLIPGEDGMAELVISGNPDGGSEKGSNAGDRKALVTRRQAEEMNEGSIRSHRSRRESRVVRDSQDDRIEVQRPLRRRANSHYVN
ncbi:hypothetical protein AA0113_g2471 [Alternaria arborescens]|uniref:Uncharacterized protein n=1 Tax=Alternaria arborescens TaxID=156630 RepID=A0A4Q4SLQ4_9PLEO|nr:hypothetical protein AA0111_g5605 [Alternaria arborescens]RYO30314.1 hypothetical protein AA0111_g5605 [Alternaria arborescens]RYO71133.1 hypothetical protein AA0113_g2471 [Alternaria arborescens]